MSKVAQPIISVTTPNRSFEGHVDSVNAVAVFPDGRRMATSSDDNTIRLWDLKDGVVLKEMEGHGCWVRALAVSRDGQLIVSGDGDGKLIVWHGDTGEFLTKVTKAHSGQIKSLDFSPDGAVLATGSEDKTTKLWSTKTWQVHGNPISCGSEVTCVRFSPSSGHGELAIATNIDIEIWNTCTRKSIAKLDVEYNASLAWTPDGTRLLLGHFRYIREWDTSTWKQIGDPWTGHTFSINALAVNFTGTLVTSASSDNHVRLWQRSDRQTIAIFKHSAIMCCVVFSMDGRHVFSGGDDNKVSQWAIPDALTQDTLQKYRALCITNGNTALSSKDFDKAIELYSAAINLISASDTIVASRRTAKISKQAEPEGALPDAPKDQPRETPLFQRFRRLIRPKYNLPENSSLGKHVTSKAIEVYSPAIDLDFSSNTIFASRCTAKLGKMLWEDALLDAQKVIEINPSSYLGYALKDAALHGAERYDEAIEAFEIMLSKLNDTADKEADMLHQRYISAHVVVQKVIDTEMENVPPRLVNTSTGRLCDRDVQINAFKTSMEYKKLLSVVMKHANLPMEHIQDVVAKSFQYVMLSHRWEGMELLLHHIQDKSVYELDPVGGTAKLQSFCRVVRDAGYHWAWSDTCCINKNNNVELQQSVNSMFVWYRHSALTVVYLSDVLPSSKSGALAMSVWNSRGWTLQEFLAPNIVLFYQSDWTLYLNDHSPNHKDSAAIMRELEDATGINGEALIAFQPGMRGAREKLQWASMRVTTLQEDIAYSLFGIFGVHLAPIYGENKQNALGRLLQEIVAKSGDITCLDWVGRPSEFNSCLPASITSYGTSPSSLSSPPSEDEMTSVSWLRDAVDAELASRVYQRFESLRTPQFIASRLHLPCIVFVVTEVRWTGSEDQRSCSTFEVKADGLRDLSITTDDKRIQPLRAGLTRRSLLLVRPWDHSLLHNFEEPPSTEGEENWSPPISPLHISPVESLGKNYPVESKSSFGELRLIARLGQPFSAFLLAQQWHGEYKRIASDQNIIAQVKDINAVHDKMDVRTIEIV